MEKEPAVSPEWYLYLLTHELERDRRAKSPEARHRQEQRAANRARRAHRRPLASLFAWIRRSRQNTPAPIDELDARPVRGDAAERAAMRRELGEQIRLIKI
jgi:hypothetical protein